MLTIRFERVGKRNKAQFKIALQEKTVAPGGRHVEILGSYDPHSKQAILKEDRIRYWLSKGAQASDTAWNLFVSKGLITDKKRVVKLPAKKVEEAVEVSEAPKTEEAKTEETVKEEKPAEEIKKEEAPIEAPIEAAKEETKVEEKKPEKVANEEKPAEAPKEESK